MINKLKRKLTLLATVSMLVLMVILVTIMNCINFFSVVSESDAVLDLLSQPNAPFFENIAPPEKPSRRIEDFIPYGMSPEVPYESRFFIAMVTADGEVKESDLSRIISVDSDSAKEYIRQAVNSDKSRGFIGQFRYDKTTDGHMTRILFLDCGRKLNTFYTFLWTSLGVGMLGCIIVYVAFLFVSGKIMKPIAESYEKQKRFISDAGHEIKTPLTIISANVDLLSGDSEKEELNEIRHQTRRLTELTNNLVYLSKMDESEHKIQKVELPLSDIVGETANSFQPVAISNQINFSMDIPPNISANGYTNAIRQLVTILLDNAVKYSPPGGSIVLSLSKNKKTVKLSVCNTAKYKINEKDLPYIFDRFYRTDISRNSETGGHGIGLSIAKAIVEAHGGSITASIAGQFDFCISVIIPQ